MHPGPVSARGGSPDGARLPVLARLARARGVYYGWVIVACVCLTMFFALGFRYAFGVFYAAILQDTGWTRADTAIVFSLAMIVYAVMALPAGWLYDRLGAKRLFTGGALLMGAGLVLCSRATTVPALLGSYGVLTGLSYAALGFIPHAAIIPRWFVKRRGVALAIALSGVGWGSLGMAYGSALLIEALGWRTTMLMCGLGAWAILIPLNILVQVPGPESIGLHPDGAALAPPEPVARTQQRVSIWRALRMRPFWLLFAYVTTVGLVTMTMAVHQPRLVVDLGFSLRLSALLFGTLGLMRTVGGLMWGPLADRIGRTPCIWLATVMSVLGFLGLLSVEHVPADWSLLRIGLLWGFTITFGIGFNGITPLYAATVAEHFWGPSLGTMFGLLDFGFGVGSALGPWVAGLIYDIVASYDLVLWVSIVGMGLGGYALIEAAARRPSHHGEGSQ